MSIAQKKINQEKRKRNSSIVVVYVGIKMKSRTD
jgi:hypothetical protein